MALSGALAGVAGALLILGTEHKYPDVFRTGYGFYGIAVALVGDGTVFFFQAEDVIRGHCVTGVQTCALPISMRMVLTLSEVMSTTGTATTGTPDESALAS